jgi:hypothetical protein
MGTIASKGKMRKIKFEMGFIGNKEGYSSINTHVPM